MQTLEAYHNYLDSLKKDLIAVMKKRLLYLEIKFRLLKHMKKKHDYERFHEILIHQKELTRKLKERKHHILNYAIKPLEDLVASDLEKQTIKKKLKEAAITYTWLYSETRFLEHQKIALKEENIYQRKHKHKIRHKISQILKRDLKAQVIKEEQELALSMKVYEKRRTNLNNYSHDILKLEKTANLEHSFLKIALALNAFPVHGIGDLLSLPFWLLDGFFRAYEHSFKEYKEWTRIKKFDTQKLELELEKIKMTI